MKVGVVGGIHEDIVGLRAALDVLVARGCASIACTGDIVGFTPPYLRFEATRDAAACLRLVRSSCDVVVAGNHDLFAARRVPSVSTFAYPADWYARPLEERRLLAHGKIWLHEDDAPVSLSAADATYLAALPEKVVAERGGARVLFSHYVAPNLLGDGTDYDAEEDGIEEHLLLMSVHGCSIAVFDHGLCGGLRIFTREGWVERGFGRWPLPPGPVAIEGPWVADGTEPSGVLVLDLDSRTVDAVPLRSP